MYPIAIACLHTQDDAQKVATRELCFNTIHKSISTRYKFVLLTKMIDTGQSAHDLAATMIKLANVDGQLMVDTPWGVRPHPKEAVQVYNQLYRQVSKSEGLVSMLTPQPRSDIFSLALPQ